MLKTLQMPISHAEYTLINAVLDRANTEKTGTFVGLTF